MKKIPVRVIVIVVVLLLLAMWFFRKEGYTLTSTESAVLQGILDGGKIPLDDRKKLKEYIRSMSTDFPAGKNPDDLRSFFNKNKENLYISDLKGFMERLAERLTREAEQKRAEQMRGRMGGRMGGSMGSSMGGSMGGSILDRIRGGMGGGMR
jgi:hypothetical protein